MSPDLHHYKHNVSFTLFAKQYTQAVSTTAHLTKYTQMNYTAIECTYISSALRRWLVLSQMEHLR